jgi:hypothetical protein
MGGNVLSAERAFRKFNDQTTENFIKAIPRSLPTEYLPIDRI